jgi:uroporphyrin-III C-methyltransferase/precorrin-2 dehydrogenase/sirohydrochlorin ferrochelatase
MMHSLALFHRIAGQPVIVLGEGEAAEAKRRLVERAGGVCVGEDHAGARLAFIAMEAPEAAAQRLKARGLLVNVTDRPELCDFTVPSLLERGPVLVAVSTGGVSAGLAKALRLRLEALLPASLGDLATGLGAARARLRARWSDAAQRRNAIDVGLAAGGPLDPLDEGSAGRLSDWLESATSSRPWRIEIVLTSTDPDDLTLRQARALGQADLILHDSDVPPAILNRARADAMRQVQRADQAVDQVAGNVVIIRLR